MESLKNSERYVFSAWSSSSTVEAAAKLAPPAEHLLLGVLVVAGRLKVIFWLVIVVGVNAGRGGETGSRLAGMKGSKMDLWRLLMAMDLDERRCLASVFLIMAH